MPHKGIGTFFIYKSSLQNQILYLCAKQNNINSENYEF